MASLLPRDPARRSLLKRAVFGGADLAESTPPLRVVTGSVLDASPQILSVAADGGGEEQFLLTEATWAWHGGPVQPAALRPGQRVLVRRDDGQRGDGTGGFGGGRAADRIWAEIGRITGTILERSGNALLVDQGHGRGRGVLVLRDGSSGRVLVHFPRLEPGYLVDVIGVRRQGVVEARCPATSQPPYHSSRVPRVAEARARGLGPVSGSASWHEPADGPAAERGVTYPALDPDTGCGDGSGSCDAATSCARLPYLSIGSILTIRNDCSGHSGNVAVTGCGSAASRFCDRCVTCGISPRGRVADLTMTSFAELGGELHSGCFNATLSMGG